MDSRKDRDEAEEAGASEPDILSGPLPDPGPIPDVLRRGPTPVMKKQTTDSGVAGMARAWAVALDFVFSVLAGAGLGWLFDRWRGTLPWGLLVGLVLGFIVAFWRIIRATQAQEREEADRKAGGNRGSGRA